MWNDTDIPLAYLITFRTYGTWLHGDERGSTNRFRNKYGSDFLPPEKNWLETKEERLAAKSVLLNASQRNYVESAIRETCIKRHWSLYALNPRTNHVHTVVAIGTKPPGMALNAFKANATRSMREAGLCSVNRSPCTRSG